MNIRAIFCTTAIALACCGLVPTFAATPAQTACVNDLPSHYRDLGLWGVLPEGRTWGSTAGIATAPDGHIWVAERCGGSGCDGSTLPPVLEFTPDGKLVQAFGAGLFVFPHGITVTATGDVWVTDAKGTNGKGEQVLEFSHHGRLLMRLGIPGQVEGDGALDQPTSVAVSKNGDVYVAEGHNPNFRRSDVVRYSSGGRRRVGILGSKGSQPGQLFGPHSLAFDSKGWLFVADRSNNRISIFDANGNFVSAWKQFGRPSGIYIDSHDRIYVTDSESNDGTGYGSNPGCNRGIRIGDARSGVVEQFIPVTPSEKPGNPAAEGITVDKSGAIYGAINGTFGVRKYAPVK